MKAEAGTAGWLIQKELELLTQLGLSQFHQAIWELWPPQVYTKPIKAQITNHLLGCFHICQVGSAFVQLNRRGNRVRETLLALQKFFYLPISSYGPASQHVGCTSLTKKSIMRYKIFPTRSHIPWWGLKAFLIDRVGCQLVAETPRLSQQKWQAHPLVLSRPTVLFTVQFWI